LTKFAEWDRHAEQFGMATLPTQVLEKLLKISDEALIAKKAALQTFVEWFALFAKYSDLHKTSITKTNGGYSIVIIHGL
jgi:hypothetical protein